MPGLRIVRAAHLIPQEPLVRVLGFQLTVTGLTRSRLHSRHISSPVSSKPSLWTLHTQFLRQYTAPQREATSLAGQEFSVSFWIIMWWLYVSRWMMNEPQGQEGRSERMEWLNCPPPPTSWRRNNFGMLVWSQNAMSPMSDMQGAYCSRWFGPACFPLRTWGLCQAHCCRLHPSGRLLGLPGLVCSLQLLLSWLTS